MAELTLAIYLNEFDPQAAEWLRTLMKRGLIPDGYVDERSIEDVEPYDLKGFIQCHFFAGIGGWPLALRMAGVLPDRPLWTGSPPCQPYSVAGQLRGPDDPRHLSPVFLRLVRECRPPVLFGEQVANAIGKYWLDHLFLNLEDKGYACGAAVLPAASVGAPHKRDRIFFGANHMAQPVCSEWDGERVHRLGEGNKTQRNREAAESAGCRGACVLADTNYDRQQPSSAGGGCEKPSSSGHDARGRSSHVELGHTNESGPQIWLRESGKFALQERREDAQRPGGLPGVSGELADAASERPSYGGGRSAFSESPKTDGSGSAPRPYSDHSGWGNADWLGCRDGKFRPVRPGSFPLANGIPARVVRLRGYGNAIVPQVAAEFIKAFDAAQAETVSAGRGRPDLNNDDLL